MQLGAIRLGLTKQKNTGRQLLGGLYFFTGIFFSVLYCYPKKCSLVPEATWTKDERTSLYHAT